MLPAEFSPTCWSGPHSPDQQLLLVATFAWAHAWMIELKQMALGSVSEDILSNIMRGDRQEMRGQSRENRRTLLLEDEQSTDGNKKA